MILNGHNRTRDPRVVFIPPNVVRSPADLFARTTAQRPSSGPIVQPRSASIGRYTLIAIGLVCGGVAAALAAALTSASLGGLNR